MGELNKGITLIALIITIIVLLILAGITISLTIGQNGMMNMAQLAGKNHINAQITENSILADYENKIIEYTSKDKTIEVINSIGDMLEICGIAGNYSIEQIANNEKNVLDKLLENEKAINYIIENKDSFKDKICNNENGMEALITNKKSVYKAMKDEDWRNSILSSQYKNILDENAVIVPNMTSNTAPSGIAFASIEYRPAYKAFLGESAGDFGWNSTGGNNLMYVGYDFGKKVMIYKIGVQGHYNWLYSGWKVQSYSSENNEWQDISNSFGMTVNYQQIAVTEYAESTKFRIIRQQTPTIVCRLQFYCIEVTE